MLTMSGSPNRKKFKQATIESFFSPSATKVHRIKKKKLDKEDSVTTSSDSVNITEDDMDPEMRTKLVAAAEKRRDKKLNGFPDRDGTINKNTAVTLSKQDSQDSYGQCSQTLDISTPLFSDSDDLSESQDTEEAANLSNKAQMTQGKGFSMNEMNTSPSCCQKLPPLIPSPSHTVLVNCDKCASNRKVVQPYPTEYRDVWDADHLRMPCSPENLYPVESSLGTKELQQRWDVIRAALTAKHTSSYDVEESILSYNARYENKWDFNGLHAFFNEVLEEVEAKEIFDNVLPGMAELALRLPEICTQGIPLLRKGIPHSVTFSQEQIASLLANAFFCTFPRRNTRNRQSEYANFPSANFIGLFEGSKPGSLLKMVEKLKCIFHYFKRVIRNMPTGNVTFTRQVINVFPKWETSTARLPRLFVTSSGTIEDAHGFLQADFANKFIGGGVLHRGCVQEEIRFLVCPEMIISRLITEVLANNEALIMTGCERYSNYKGYANTFCWDGNYDDNTPRDAWHRRCIAVFAIDAIVIRDYAMQFNHDIVSRECNKAFAGVVSLGVQPCNLSAIATGNWGCGAFGGDKQLKALIQLMAAAEARRDMVYYTFGDVKFQKVLYEMHKFVVDHDLTIGDLWAQIQQYKQNVCRTMKAKSKPNKNLYEYIYDGVLGLDSGSETSSVTNNSRSGSEDWQKNTP